MASSKREKILRMLDGERTGEVFCSHVLSACTLEQMGALSVYWPDAHTDPELMVKLAESMYTMLGFEGVRNAFDTAIEAEALGAKVNMGDRTHTVYVTKPAFNDPNSFRVPQNLFELGRFPIQFKALSILVNKYRDEIPIYGLVIGPMTLLGHLFGVDTVMRWTLKEPTLFQSLLGQVSDVVASYGNLLIDKGVDALVLGEPTASPNLISPKTFEKFLVPIYGKLSEVIKGRVILHICGDTNCVLEFIVETGFSAFSFEGPIVPVKKAKEILGDRMALFGNIPTIEVLMNGTVEDVKRATLRAIEDGVDSVIPSCGIPIQTPINNARAISETVREYNKRKGFL